jgi:hypothetical protein
MKKLFCILIAFAFYCSSYGQALGVQWSRPLGGTAADRGIDIQKTNDGGSLLLGQTLSTNGDVTGNHGGQDIWVTKLNLFGGIEWKKALGGSGTETAHRLIYHNDGTALIVASTTSTNGDAAGHHGSTDIWLVKIDGSGAVLWQKPLGGTAGDEYRYIDVLSDNSYILTGYTNSNDGDVFGNHGGEDIWVVKISTSGNIEWQKTLGGTGSDRPRFIMPMPDGDFVMVGSTASNNGDVTGHHGNNDLWVVRLDGIGNIKWQKPYGGTQSETGFRAVVSATGSITVMANAMSTNGDVVGFAGGTTPDVWVVDVAYNNGAINWQQCIGGTRLETPVTIVKDADNKYLVCSITSSWDGAAASNHGQDDILLTRITSTGAIEWSKSFGGTKLETLRTVYNDTSSRNYVFAASSNSIDGDVVGSHQTVFQFDTTATDAWIVGVSYNGTIDWQKSLGGTSSDHLYSMQKSGTSEFILAGETWSDNGDVRGLRGFVDIWAVKISPINTIKGTLYLDNNLNGSKENDEPYYSDAIIKIEKGGAYQSTIMPDGYFEFKTDTGSYTLSVQPDLPYFTVVPPTKSYSFSSYFNTDSTSFALQPVSGKKDLTINIIPITPARPGFDVTYKVSYKNVGTQEITTGQVLFKYDSRLSLLSATPAQASTNGDTLKFNYVNLKVQDTASITLKFKIQAPPAVNNGDSLLLAAFILPVLGDETPSDDTAFLKQLVVGSYDPNDKYENNGGIIRPQYITDRDYLNYTIRFQNTGTDTAFTVVVRDTLDARLEWSTLQMVASSHSNNLTIDNNSQLTWTFTDIHLPDSNRNEPASHGYISYRIKPKSSVALGDTIHNYASIYFDFNLPIVTNNAFTVVKDVQLIALPVKLLSFSGSYKDGSAQLQWRIAEADNLEKFEVERSLETAFTIQA